MSKTAKILALTKKGLKAAVIAKRVKTSVNYVYIVRSNASKGKKTGGKKLGRPAGSKSKATVTGLSKVQARRLGRAIKLLQSI